MLAVAQAYPNAKVAPDALLAAAGSYEAAENHRQAAQLLRQLYFRYPQSADKLAVIEALARNYLAMPSYTEVAVARLAQAAKLDPNARLSKPLKMPDGKMLADMSIADALKSLRQYHEQATARSLPELKLPAYKHVPGQEPARSFAPITPDSTIQNISAIIAPLARFWANRSYRHLYADGRRSRVRAPAQPSRSFPAVCSWNNLKAALGSAERICFCGAAAGSRCSSRTAAMRSGAATSSPSQWSTSQPPMTHRRRRRTKTMTCPVDWSSTVSASADRCRCWAAETGSSSCRMGSAYCSAPMDRCRSSADSFPRAFKPMLSPPPADRSRSIRSALSPTAR